MHYLLSYLLPRALALTHPEPCLKATSWLILIIHYTAYPFAHFLRTLGYYFLKPFGLSFPSGINLLDVQVQIRALGEEDATLSPFTKKILQNALRLRDLEASDILLPRNQVKYMDLTEPVATNLAKAKVDTHTRFPLCKGDLDHCVGIIHIKDIFRYEGDLQALDLQTVKRPVAHIAADTSVQIILRRLLRHKMHMALVVDEFKRTVGVITLENILEELVGDIQDEFDSEESLVEPLGEGRFKVDGLAPLHEVEDELKITIDNEEVSTFGGYITAELGHIPASGKKFKIDNLDVEILEADKKRVILALVSIPLNNDTD